MKGIRHRDPAKTRNGRTRLGPLNITQLEDAIEKTSKPREKDRFRTRLAQMISRKNKENLKNSVDKATRV